MGKAEGATQRVQRLVLSHRSLAREFSENDLSKHFKANGSINVEDASYQTMVRDGFANWRLKIDGLVERPASLSLDELRAFAVAHADHAPRLRRRLERHREMERRATGPLLQSVGLKPNARYLVFHCADMMSDLAARPTTRASI